MNRRLLIVLWMGISMFQGMAQGEDFILAGSDSLTVTSQYEQGFMSGSSSVDIQPGGEVGQLFADGDCTVEIAGGSVGDMSAYGTAEVVLSSGSVVSLVAGGSSKINVFGGVVTAYLGGFDNSEITFTGGVVPYYDAGGASLTTFHGYGWSASDGMSIVRDEVVGTGTLSGYWADGTSWSTPIWKADTATIRLVSDEDPCGECRGKVTELTLQYAGSEPATVRVEQKGKKSGRTGKGKKGKRGRRAAEPVVVFEDELDAGESFAFAGLDEKGTLGTEISLYIDDQLNTRIHTSCSKPIYPGLISGLFEIVEGVSRNGGLLCPLDVEPPEDGCGCKGKVTELTLLYTGDSVDPIVVTGKGKKNKPQCDILNGPVIFFEDDVHDIVTTTVDGRVFTLHGYDKKGTLGTEISLYVGGDLNTKIHTSCSKPIGVGSIFGDFEIIEGSSKDGGPLCAIE